MKYYISLLIIIVFISCRDKGYKFHKKHDVLYEGQKMAIPEYYRRIIGYDSVQFIDFMDKPEANFCYPNEWQFKKFRDTVVSYNPSKCKIKKIGKVYKENGGTVVAGWSFDCSGFRNDYIGGTVPYENLIGGWTVTQLKLIAQFQDTSLFTPDSSFVIEDWYSGKSVDIGYGRDTIYTEQPLVTPYKNKK